MNFNELDIRELDKNLSPEEQIEWNNIYSSYRSESTLSGRVSGVDSYTIGGESSLVAVIIDFRVKILIPEKELWEKPMQKSVTRNILGAKIDFIITGIDRENNCAVASRVQAMKRKQKKFLAKNPKEGGRLKCKVLVVGQKRLTVECHGFDLTLTQKELSYAIIYDLRECYHSGQELSAVITRTPTEVSKLEISVRDTIPHPYNGIKERHPLNSRRYTEIFAKYKGSIFCRLEKDFDCLCKLSGDYLYDDFKIGDKVVIVVKRHNDDTKRVYGTIVSKWH